MGADRAECLEDTLLWLGDHNSGTRARQGDDLGSTNADIGSFASGVSFGCSESRLTKTTQADGCHDSGKTG